MGHLFEGAFNCKPEISRKQTLTSTKMKIYMYLQRDSDKSYSDDCTYTLVGHIPVELSSLLKSLFNNEDPNEITAIVTGSRKRENGLVVPCLYLATQHRE